MNLTCIQCGCLFVVSLEQIGRRGRCPNCHARLKVPGLRQRGAPSDGAQRAFESGWDRSIAAGVAIVGLALLLLALSRTSSSPGSLAPNRDISDVEVYVPPLERIDMPTLSQMVLETESPLSVLEPLDANTLMSHEIFGANTWAPEHLFNNTNSGGVPSTIDFVIDAANKERSVQPETFENLLGELERDGLDLVIMFDSTLSMEGEISQVKSQIRALGQLLVKLVPKTRIGVCAYRDRGDSYVVKGLPLTEKLSDVVGFVASVEAAGGGDEAEAVDEGLRWVMANNDFRAEARKVILVFGDAPPHIATQADCATMAIDFRRLGGVLSTVTCRSEKPMEAFVEMAQLGGGESFLNKNQRQIVSQLIVLVFGSQHQQQVLESYRLLQK